MALKTSNKNRKKSPVVEAVEDTVVDTHETTMAAITQLAEFNTDINKRTITWSVVGVAIGVLLLLVII